MSEETLPIEGEVIQAELIPTEPVDPLGHILPDLRPLAVPMDTLVLDPDNAKKHDARNLKVIANSLQRFGQRTPLTVNKRTMIIEKGNGTFQSAQLLGWTMIAVVWSDDDEDDATAYGLVDNRSSELATWDYTKSGQALRKLRDANQPLLDIGWTEEEALPLLTGEFQPVEVSDDKFDTSLMRGRSINKLSVAQRNFFDQALERLRAITGEPWKDGTALEHICSYFLEKHPLPVGYVAPADSVTEDKDVLDVSEDEDGVLDVTEGTES